MFKLVGIEFTYEQFAAVASNILKRERKITASELRDDITFFNLTFKLARAIPKPFTSHCQWWVTADPPESENPEDERMFFIVRRYEHRRKTPSKFKAVPITERDVMSLAWLSDAEGIDPEELVKMWKTVPQIGEWN